MPTRILDLYAEFSRLTSGVRPPHGRGLLGALAYFGLPVIDAAEKSEMRDLAIRGGPYTSVEQSSLLNYCQTDVDALARLLELMLPSIDMPRALLRGRYSVAVARMESNGVPIDAKTLASLRANWDRIKSEIVAAVDEQYDVFVPADRNLDPSTRFGTAIMKAARSAEVDPYALADAAEYIAETEKEGGAPKLEAVRPVRSATGLSRQPRRETAEQRARLHERFGLRCASPRTCGSISGTRHRHRL